MFSLILTKYKKIMDFVIVLQTSATIRNFVSIDYYCFSDSYDVVYIIYSK